MFEDLELPDLERKALRQIPADRIAKREGLSAGRHPRPARQAAHRRASGCGASCARRQRRDGDARPRRTPAGDRRGASRSTTTTSSTATSITDVAEGVERRRRVHHGHVRLDGHDEEVPGAELLLPALPVHLHQVPQRRDRLHRPPHRGATRSPRTSSSTRASPAARSSRRATPKALEIISDALPPVALERLRVPLLRRRQLRLRQPDCPAAARRS